MKRRWLVLGRLRPALLGAALGGVLELVRARRRWTPLPLHDKVVVLTGAAGGIGGATARAFAAQGARLVLADRRDGPLNAVQQELASYGVATLIVPTDIRRDDELDVLLDSTLRTFGRLDVLVNLAGLALGGPFQEQDPARLREMVETNVVGSLRLTQLALPVMLAQGNGHIVVVSSTTAPVPTPGLCSYGATKAALRYFAHALRHELAGTGVRVSAVLPGWTRTAMVAAVPEGPIRAAGIAPDEPEAVAEAILRAVRYDLPEVALGGSRTALFFLLQRFFPGLMGHLWRPLLTPEYLDAVRRL